MEIVRKAEGVLKAADRCITASTDVRGWGWQGGREIGGGGVSCAHAPEVTKKSPLTGGRKICVCRGTPDTRGARATGAEAAKSKWRAGHADAHGRREGWVFRAQGVWYLKALVMSAGRDPSLARVRLCTGGCVWLVTRGGGRGERGGGGSAQLRGGSQCSHRHDSKRWRSGSHPGWRRRRSLQCRRTPLRRPAAPSASPRPPACA